MFRIHSAPRALLAMFGMKNEGRNPPDMPETIQCTADVLDNYLEQFQGRTTSGLTTVTTPTTVGSATVTPTNGNMWRVWGVTGTLTLAAGDIAVDTVQYLDLIAAGGGAVPLLPPQVVTASMLGRPVSFWFPRPIIIRPGVTFTHTGLCLSAPGSNWTIDCTIYSQAVPE